MGMSQVVAVSVAVSVDVDATAFNVTNILLSNVATGRSWLSSVAEPAHLVMT